MAARRLLIIMVALLAISTLAAALVPPPEEQAGSSSTSTTTTTTAPEHRGGDLVRAEVTVGAKGAPKRVPVKPGDQVALTVSSPRFGKASVPAFGLVDFAEQGAPARFDLLVSERGSFPVRFTGEGTVATVVARARGARHS